MFCAIATIVGNPVSAQSADDEFVGPFSSWLDVKRDFGAVGDGTADDAPALQQALDAIRQNRKASVLYLPAGTYRLTKTLHTARKAHQDNMVSVVGEDPNEVVLKWDGPQDGTILQWDAWYAKLSRLTFDGAHRAAICVQYGPSFSTCNETSDLILRDATTGILFGSPETKGQAENAVVRCRFERCETGILTANWNSMDIWIWHCRFEDCRRGVHNVMGSWHAWENLFLRSKDSDVSIANLMAFSVVNNTSVGSNRFLDFSGGHVWGSPTSITGNRVLDPIGDCAMVLDNAGPYLVVDNVMRLGDKTEGIRMTWGDQTLVGNVYSKESAVQEKGRFRRIDEKIVAPKDIADSLPTLPGTPPRRERRVFDLPSNAKSTAIQEAINEAAKLVGQRPVVHLPMGEHRIGRTIVIPPGCDVQLVGDGASEVATRLVWIGPRDGVVLRVDGPSKATLRDFQIQGGKGRALLIQVPDQEEGRIFADQLNTNGPTAKRAGNFALRVAGFDKMAPQFRALQGNGNAGTWVEVEGTGSDPETAPAVGIFTGASSSADGGQYSIRNGGKLVVRGVYHERSSGSLSGVRLVDSGMLSIDATRFSYATSEKTPTIAADNFRGLFTLATCILMPVGTKESCRFELRGDGGHASVLALNNQFVVQQPGTSAQTIWLNQAQPPASGGLIGSNINTNNKEVAKGGFAYLHNIGDSADTQGSTIGPGNPLAEQSCVDDATILRHLAPLRAAKPWSPSETPAGMTDVRIHRVVASGGGGPTVEIRAAK
jgi:hypothetical protein